MQNTRRAFSLIELLVAISIIALLIAILIPVLSNVMFSSRTTQCASRLKQIGIAVTAYSMDNDGYMPHDMSLMFKTPPSQWRYLNTLDNQYYRWEHKPWVIKSKDQFDYVPLIENYVSDLSEIFVCPHIDYDWDKNYSPSTNATVIPYAMYWGISNTGTPTASRIPMTQLGEGFGPGNRLDGGGITYESRYKIIASDAVRLGTSYGINKYPDGTPFDAPKAMANHPPTGGDYFYAQSGDGNGYGYVYDDTINGNANYAYDDGSVVLYGQISKDTIGDNAEHEFRRAERWLAPTDRVEK